MAQAHAGAPQPLYSAHQWWSLVLGPQWTTTDGHQCLTPENPFNWQLPSHNVRYICDIFLKLQNLHFHDSCSKHGYWQLQKCYRCLGWRFCWADYRSNEKAISVLHNLIIYKHLKAFNLWCADQRTVCDKWSICVLYKKVCSLIYLFFSHLQL